MLTNKDYKIISWLVGHGYKIKRAQDIRRVTNFENGSWNKKTAIYGKINTVYEFREPDGRGSKELGEFELKELLKVKADQYHLN